MRALVLLLALLAACDNPFGPSEADVAGTYVLTSWLGEGPPTAITEEGDTAYYGALTLGANGRWRMSFLLGPEETFLVGYLAGTFAVLDSHSIRLDHALAGDPYSASLDKGEIALTRTYRGVEHVSVWREGTSVYPDRHEP